MNDDLIRLLFLSHAAATWYMTGVIWFVQVVHYPLFAAVGSQAFSTYEQRHTSLTTWVVAPPMLVEAATAVLLFWLRPPGVLAWQLWTGVILVAAIWLLSGYLAWRNMGKAEDYRYLARIESGELSGKFEPLETVKEVLEPALRTGSRPT